jgi:hypothetical protein
LKPIFYSMTGRLWLWLGGLWKPALGSRRLFLQANAVYRIRCRNDRSAQHLGPERPVLVPNFWGGFAILLTGLGFFSLPCRHWGYKPYFNSKKFS